MISDAVLKKKAEAGIEPSGSEQVLQLRSACAALFLSLSLLRFRALFSPPSTLGVRAWLPLSTSPLVPSCEHAIVSELQCLRPVHSYTVV